MRGWVTCLGIVVACAAAGAASAQDAAVYKWVDSNGTVNYSDQPPVGTAAEALPIRSRRAERASVQARAKAPGQAAQEAPDAANAATEDTEDADAGAEGVVSDDERAQLLAQRENNCKLAKQRMASYEQARRIYRPGPGGERVYLTNEQLDAERATARVAVAEWCDE